MTYASIKDLLDEIGLPYTYHHWDEENVPELPWIVFDYPAQNDFLADDSVYQRITALQIDLYTDRKDLQTEAMVEQVLEQNGIVYTKEETYIASEKMYEITYETELIING